MVDDRRWADQQSISELLYGILSLDPIYQSVCSWNVYPVKKKNRVQCIVVSFCRRILIVCLYCSMLACLGAFQRWWTCRADIRHFPNHFLILSKENLLWSAKLSKCGDVTNCNMWYTKITINKKIEMACFVLYLQF